MCACVWGGEGIWPLRYHSRFGSSCFVECSPIALAAVDVGIGVTITGAGSRLTAESVISPSIVFPLRLGVACTLGVPLGSVIVISVSSFTAGIPGPTFSISSADEVNTRTAVCPVSSVSRRRLVDGLLGVVDDTSARVLAPSEAPLVTSSAEVNGTYVVVKLVVTGECVVFVYRYTRYTSMTCFHPYMLQYLSFQLRYRHVMRILLRFLRLQTWLAN